MAFVDYIEQIGFFRLFQKTSLAKNDITPDSTKPLPPQDTIKQPEQTLTPIRHKYLYQFKIPHSAVIVNTPAYFVVNKFCDVVTTSPSQSRSIIKHSEDAHNSFFLSQQDAIDFIYKIAQTRPRYFKRMGLGINSIPLTEYLKNYRNHTTSLLAGTEEFETFIKKRKLASENIYKSTDADPYLEFDRNKSLLIAYRVKNAAERFKKPQPESEPIKIYLKLEDAMKDERIQKGIPVVIEAGRIAQSDLFFHQG